ncbi:MAG: SGNH/GDSL hydrolase family protein [Proteobacteria bacterium]|nr:MAG: SGNH/GDSL hydrolase family protein [Pseudomonadota bacterium]
MNKYLMTLLSAVSMTALPLNAEPKVLYVGDSIAMETADVVTWWAHNYIGATTTRAMYGGLAICDFTTQDSSTESSLTQRVKTDKPDIVVLQFVGNAFTPCMQNLGSDPDAYYKKYASDTNEATRQITAAAAAVNIPRPKIMWVLRGPTEGSDQAKRIITQYRNLAAKNGDLVSDAGKEVSMAAYPGTDYETARYQFTRFVPCSDFERSAGYCTDEAEGLARVHKDDDGTHFCLGDEPIFICHVTSPGILRYGMKIAQDIKEALIP